MGPIGSSKAGKADALEPDHSCYDMPMREGATELGTVWRHVEVGSRHIGKQRALIARLRQRALPINAPEALLILFEDVQRQHEEHLPRLDLPGKDRPATGGGCEKSSTPRIF